MSWNENKGGPWGSAGGNRPKNPWQNNNGSGNGGGNGQQPPPDIDAVWREIQQKMNQYFPGGQHRSRGIFVAVLVVAGLWLASGFYQVSAGQLGVVLRFGSPTRIEAPGLRYHLPMPIEQVILPDVTSARKTEIGFSADRRGNSDRDIPDESMMLTGDENIIDVNFEVIWQVDPVKVKDYLFNIRDPELMVKAAAESVMRDVIGTTNIQTALTGGRSLIEQRTIEYLQKLLSQYQAGILITQVNLRSARPPAEVADAFQDVTRARSDKETAINKAETYKSRVVPEAEGEAARKIQEAEAYKKQVVNIAKGNAERFLSVYESYKLSKDTTAKQMYMDAMESILQDAHKIVIDPKNGSGTTSYLPLNELIKPPATQKSSRN
ncbi:MAG: FtsH protease activity modulator HflK [Alphaproteobacteria bacterium]|nr:FtsH protease activity modulator HflK [Alphaproteobacteria bacterium]